MISDQPQSQVQGLVLIVLNDLDFASQRNHFPSCTLGSLKALEFIPGGVCEGGSADSRLCSMRGPLQDNPFLTSIYQSLDVVTSWWRSAFSSNKDTQMGKDARSALLPCQVPNTMDFLPITAPLLQSIHNTSQASQKRWVCGVSPRQSLSA